MIKWLQISDLHIKARADWKNFERELLEKCEKLGGINLVIVTGDFHDFWEKEDFHLAKEFLEKLMKYLCLDIEEDLFLVPGNHDGVSSIKNKNTHIKALRQNPLDDDAPGSFKELERAFEDYENFVKELIPKYPVKHPAAVHVRCWRNKINFIHCNTAIGADGVNKDNQMINVDELAEIEMEDGKTNIILAHNSFVDIDERLQNRINDCMRLNHIAAYFCGDRHRQELNSIEIDRKKDIRIPCVVNYKSAPDATDNYSEFGIIIGEWSGQKAVLQGWIWKSGEGFEIDAKITGTEISMCNEEKKNEAIEKKEKSHEIISKKDEENLMYTFNRYYHKMTPHAFVLYNAVYKEKGWIIKEGFTEEELFDYMAKAKKAGKLKELIEFIGKLI